MASKKTKTLAAIVAAGAITVGAEALNTTYDGQIIRVIDSDTAKVELFVIPAAGLTWTVDIRALGIDTPELRRPDKTCHDGGLGEKKLAELATSLIKSKLPEGTPVRITHLGLGKFAGRALGQIWFQENGNWVSTSKLLTDRKMAVEYWGGKKSSWCNAHEKWKALQFSESRKGARP